MSFYTALTGLNGSSADISATSNNIANVGTTGFKRSRVEFGDIFATSPLQNASSSIGSGTILKGIKQQFTQGNIAASLNALDLAISGQGFFALKPSLTSAQTVYTRNGSLNVNNDRYVVDSAGQYLLTYPVNTDGSVTAKDLDSALPLQLPVTSGDPQATSNIKLGVNVNAASDVVTDRAQFQDGYSFDPNDPETFTNSTSITIFDDLGNPTIATVYFVKTQAASADDPTNKYDTRLVINDTIITPDLVSAVDDAGKQIFVDRFGQQTTSIPDDNYFIEGKGSPLYKLDDLQTLVPSEPAKLSGEQTSFDFGEEGDKLVEIVTDPMKFKATREAGNSGSDVYWGKDFLLVNVDDSDQPVSIDINPGLYNADQLAAEVERAVNAAYGDDRKFQVEQNIDDTITLDFQRVGADGSVSTLANKVAVELLGTNSYVTEAMAASGDFAISGTSPDFTKEQFLAHSQIRINETLNQYSRTYTDDPLGTGGLQFTKSTGEKISSVYEYTQVVELERVDDPEDKNYMVHSFYGKRPTLSVHTNIDDVSGNGTNFIEYNSTEDRLRIFLESDGGSNVTLDDYQQGKSITLAGDNNFSGDLNGRNFIISGNGSIGGYKYIDVSSSGLTLADSDFEISSTAANAPSTIKILTSPSADPAVEAFFEGTYPVYEGAKEDYSSQKIIIREKQGTSANTASGAFVASDWLIQNGSEGSVLKDNLSLLGLHKLHRPMEIKEGTLQANSDINLTFTDGTNTLKIDTSGGGDTTGTATALGASPSAGDGYARIVTELMTASSGVLPDLKGFSFSFFNAGGEVLYKTTSFAADGVTETPKWSSSDTRLVTVTPASGNTTITSMQVSRDDMTDFVTSTTNTSASFTASISLDQIEGSNSAAPTNIVSTASETDLTTTILTKSSIDWIDEKDPAVKVGYDAVNQRLSYQVDRTVLGSGTDSDFNTFSVFGGATQTGINNLGLSNADNAQRVAIRGGEVLYGEPFTATGEEIQPNDKRFGIKVEYNSEFQNFSIASGTTGEAIPGNGALGVSEQQKASNIQVGRYSISETTGARTAQPYDVDSPIIGNGDNSLFGVGQTKNDFLLSTGKGLQAKSAQAIGASANEPLTNVFKLSTQNGDNIFNVSVNGISGIINVPATSYVGTTLAESLQTRINQIVDPSTGDTIGGVTVAYSSETNSFTFSTGTTGSDSTIKVKGAARLGLDDVPLGVGTVPEIYNLVQATDADGVALYVDANGEVVTNPPENMVDGYFPLYIDEGELTFDKTGKLVSPKNLVHYEKQEEGFSISLDVDFSTSTQLAQPFSVLTVEQDGFTSGRLDGIEIDSSGTIRANYTNGQNNPLGKIVVANFNNQNGLKQIGNATYTETAVSGTPQVGEAGSEGFGNILSGSLERSNVDITEELVNLITAQRNFQASAKAIETTTGLTQTIINIRM
ncbi:MAG: flagellar hook-basal body complex protein [Alphaproteobacteria bacterium]|nr:flagellar hook-basal body complex protein [Alphaproteobacteria bacterium]